MTGTLHSADGISTEPIGVEDFSEGTIIISGPDGGALPASLGGSFRAVFPEGAAVQTSVCRTHARPVNRAVSMMTLRGSVCLYGQIHASTVRFSLLSKSKSVDFQSLSECVDFQSLSESLDFQSLSVCVDFQSLASQCQSLLIS